MVAGEACNAQEARSAIKSLNPDVITLDVEMPGMNGLDFLEKIMLLRPMPVIMVSSETKKGSEKALEALSLGAVECIGKPFGQGLSSTFDRLPDLICAAAKSRPRPWVAPHVDQVPRDFIWNGKIVLIGASTGGVDALQTILSAYPANCAPTIIAQHMPEAFLASFARRLAGRIAPKVMVASEGTKLIQGVVLLAPGGCTNIELCETGNLSCRLVVGRASRGFTPSIDALFRSAVPIASEVVAALLTGMGRDGAAGMLELRQAGARCIVQDRESSIVYGMPRAAMELEAADCQLPITAIAPMIRSLCRVS